MLILAVVLSCRWSLAASDEVMRNDAKLGNSVGSSGAIIDKIANGEAFSFLYDGKQSQDILRQWKHTEKTTHLSDGTEILVSTYRDVETGVEASTEVTRFPGAPAAEFILYLRNTGTRDTGIFEKILPLNVALSTGAAGKAILHYARGSLGKVEDYLPIDKEVASGTPYCSKTRIREKN